MFEFILFLRRKEAQKCFCGAENCRGTIGGSKMTPLKSKRKEAEKKKVTELFEDDAVWTYTKLLHAVETR